MFEEKREIEGVMEVASGSFIPLLPEENPLSIESSLHIKRAD